MSIKIVHEEIKRFLSETEPEVICIKGKWGVGKTYAWNHYLREAQRDNSLYPKQYAYVSLFGLKSLEDIKYALFESTISTSDLETGPSESSVKSNLGWLKRNYRKGASIIANAPFLQQYLGGSERALFFLVKNQIVCIDDLERVGGGVEARDILGLISYLKEERKCKVALLLNEEKLSPTEREVFAELLEKVVDTKLDFNPTPQEAADIVFPSPEGTRKLLHKHCVALGITNIRVIKKIERIALRLEEVFGADSPILPQAIHTAVLMGWSVYQPKEAPSVDFITDMKRIHGIGRENKDASPEEKNWRDLLREYSYSSSDEFDLVILKTIQDGFFDTKALQEAGQKQIKGLEDAQAKQEFSNAWDLYHDSFKDNEDELLTRLYESAKGCAKTLEPWNLDSTLTFLKDFGRTKQASDLLAYYLEVRSNDRELYESERSLFARDMKDPDLLAAFATKKESFEDTRDPADVLMNITDHRGWNPEDITLLSKLSEDDFYKIFKETEGRKFHCVLKAALDFGKIQGLGETEKQISIKATVALKRIAKESKLNEMRVKSKGVKLDEENTAPTENPPS